MIPIIYNNSNISNNNNHNGLEWRASKLEKDIVSILIESRFSGSKTIYSFIFYESYAVEALFFFV